MDAYLISDEDCMKSGMETFSFACPRFVRFSGLSSIKELRIADPAVFLEKNV